MKKTVSLLSLILLGTTTYYAQTGINTPDPGSTLHVNGSFAAQYRAVTATMYAMNETDFHVSYNGTGNATFTLPTAITGAGNFKGRLYTIKNNTTSTVTINPSASETIGGNVNIALAAHQSVQIINTGLTGASTTWEVVAYNNTGNGVGCVPDYMFVTLASNSQATLNSRINFNSVKSNSGTGITVNNGVFTLQAGKTYELEANLFAVDFFNNETFLQAAWKNTATNTVLTGSTVAEIYSVGYITTRNSLMPVSKAVITPTTNMTVALDITGANAYATINNNQSYAMIRQLNSCGGGGSTTTPGTTYSGSASVNLNGNTFERAALTGDTTADTNSNATTVVGLQGNPVASTTPQSEDLLSYNGTSWNPTSRTTLGIPKQIVSVSVPGNQNYSPATDIIVSFTTENYDPNNAWTNNVFTVPAGMAGTYTVNAQTSNGHTATGSNDGWWVMNYLEKSTNGGSTWTRLIADIRSGLKATDADNGNGIFWTGNLNAGDRVRLHGQCSSTTSNVIMFGNLAITKL